MDLYQFAQKTAHSGSEGLLSSEKEALTSSTNAGRMDAVAEAQDRYFLKLDNRKPLVFKLKAMARQAALDKYPQGALVDAKRLNRNLFDGLRPWTYLDGWGNLPVEPLPDGLYEVVGYIDQTYQSGRWLRGHIYMVVSLAD